MTKPKIRVVGKRIVRDESDIAGADLSDILFDDAGHMCVQEERLVDPTDDAATAELRATRLSAYASAHAKLPPSAFAAFHALGDVFEVESAVIDARLTARSPHVLVDVILPSHRWRMAVERAFNCALLAFACPHVHASTELQHCLPEKQRFGTQEYGIDAGYALDRLRQKNVLVTRLAEDGLPPALSPHVDVSIDMSMLSGTYLAAAVDRAFEDGNVAATRRSAWPNAIAPGAVDGPRIQHVFEARAQASGGSVEDARQEMMAIQSIKRMVDPADIAALAVFLASDAAKSISGQILPIDNDALKAS